MALRCRLRCYHKGRNQTIQLTAGLLSSALGCAVFLFAARAVPFALSADFLECDPNARV